jgi:hypothetical protein
MAKTAKTAKTGSPLEERLLAQVRIAGLPEPEQQLAMRLPPKGPGRRVRTVHWDFAWPSRQLVVDVQGGVFVNGRHSRGAGYSADADKSNAATEAGWAVYRFTPDMVRDGRAVALLARVLTGAVWAPDTLARSTTERG